MSTSSGVSGSAASWLSKRAPMTFLFTSTIFLSAFLLFLVQPMIGKRALPFFGGSTAVWATSLLIFTGLLFAGYAYVYWISRRPVSWQVRIHAALLILGTAALVLMTYLRHSVFPSLDWTLESSLPPSLQVMAALLAAIGIPYFLLATTSPLLQHWYSIATKSEPYRLYAVSNLASFLALGAYPFLIEPNFALVSQASFWGLGYLLFAGMCAAAALVVFLAVPSSSSLGEARNASHISWKRRMEWILFSALPGALLVATTTELTQTIAPIPFLWIVPLSLYLISFIIAFRGWGESGWIPVIAFVSVFLAYRSLEGDVYSATPHLLIDLVVLFLVSLYCHAQVFRLRPGPHDSSLLYLCTSFGGMLGVLSVTLLAPVVFTKLWDFPLMLALAAVIIVYLYPAEQYFKDEFHASIPYVRVGAVCLIVALSVQYFVANKESEYVKSRNFYGVVKITDWYGTRNMYSGTTLHGSQYLEESKLFVPTTYYVPTSGVGRAIEYARSPKPRPLNIGVVGLGTGTIAAYCQPKDTFTFYEIDGRIERLARTYYSFLHHCGGSSVRIGDGRLVLERELRNGKPGEYDVLAVDAFSDDTIPTHLLTKEAFAVYAGHVKEKGIIAIHTSNRYFTLSPVVARIGKEFGFESRIIADGGGEENAGASSIWVILSRDASVVGAKQFSVGTTTLEGIEAPLWTDDYVNVFAALNVPFFGR